MTRSCKDIRNEFIEFFKQRGHTPVPSSSLLPADDPTLLFTNAGMNQFKDIFLGREKRPYVRAVNSQKCIRAGGKHNDLEDVGHDTYHHTFFEMLGNWSFGDYFKPEAIQWAWELLTKVWGLDKDKLWATYFGGSGANDSPDEVALWQKLSAGGIGPDLEVAQLWRETTDLPRERIVPGWVHDNFWAPGDTGPCGPCSEVSIDLGPQACGGRSHPGKGCGVNVSGCGRFIELWNLVFIQFNRDESGKLTPLPAKHVDTGMGLERMARVLQGADSNYGTDVFRGIFDALHAIASTAPYTGKLDDLKDVAYRVVADHARALTFAIADGVRPSNEGRGYVLRRILRRAARYGRQYLDIHEPFLVKLVPAVVQRMGESFPEIVARQKHVQDTIRQEEESFGRTLDRGIELFQRQAERLLVAEAKALPGEVAFDLYATYGFPVDLTQIMAAERGMTVDMDGFQAEMEQHRQVSGAADAFKAEAIANLPATDDSSKHLRQPIQAKVLGWVIDGRYVSEGKLAPGQEAAVVLDRTNFYGEQGGQVGDSGVLSFAGGRFAVKSAGLAGQCVLHAGVLEQGELAVGQAVTARVDPSRLDTMRNHTATHLLNWALREALGDHVHQAGSVVAPDRLRFDFTHDQALTEGQLEQVERAVNERILADEPVQVRQMPLAEARTVPGVRAVFGEKYPDPVRVVMIGPAGEGAACGLGVSAEFCGGTHLERTGQVGLFKVLSEESVAKGVRRITAVSGHGALACVQQAARQLAQAAEALRCRPEQLPERIAAMQKEIKQFKKRPAGAGGAAEFQSDFVADSPQGKVLVGRAETADPAAMRNLCDIQRQKGAAAILLGAAEDGKVTLVAMVSEELAKAGKLTAGDWVKVAAAAVGGSGGGKPTLAQAGGKQPENLPQALQQAAEFARRKLQE